MDTYVIIQVIKHNEYHIVQVLFKPSAIFQLLTDTSAVAEMLSIIAKKCHLKVRIR